MHTLTDYKARTDLAALLAADLRQEPKRSGKWLVFSCPFPGHKHGDKNRSLAVVNPTPSRPGYWKCFGCGRSGTAVDWLAEYRNMSIKDITAMLRDSAPLPVAPIPAAPEPVAPVINLRWQELAHHLMTQAQAALWADAGRPAREYLMRERKFSESMLRTWNIGFVPETRFELKTEWGITPLENERPKMVIRRGITIPCYESGIIAYIKTRVLPAEQKNDEPKYRKLAGSQPGIMGLDTVLHTETVFATEGEFNLLPLWEGINRLSHWHHGAISFGSASDYEALRLHAERFLPVRRIIAYFDSDNAGNAARRKLAEMTGRITFATLPAKDLADYHAAGNDISAWCAYHIERAEIVASEPGFEK